MVRRKPQAATPQRNLKGRTFAQTWVRFLRRATALQVLVLRDEESPLSVAIRENVRAPGPLRQAASISSSSFSTNLGLRRLPRLHVCRKFLCQEERPSTRGAAHPGAMDATVMVGDA